MAAAARSIAVWGLLVGLSACASASIDPPGPSPDNYDADIHAAFATGVSSIYFQGASGKEVLIRDAATIQSFKGWLSTGVLRTLPVGSSSSETMYPATLNVADGTGQRFSIGPYGKAGYLVSWKGNTYIVGEFEFLRAHFPARSD